MQGGNNQQGFNQRSALSTMGDPRYANSNVYRRSFAAANQNPPPQLLNPNSIQPASAASSVQKWTPGFLIPIKHNEHFQRIFQLMGSVIEPCLEPLLKQLCFEYQALGQQVTFIEFVCWLMQQFNYLEHTGVKGEQQDVVAATLKFTKKLEKIWVSQPNYLTGHKVIQRDGVDPDGSIASITSARELRVRWQLQMQSITEWLQSKIPYDRTSKSDFILFQEYLYKMHALHNKAICHFHSTVRSVVHRPYREKEVTKEVYHLFKGFVENMKMSLSVSQRWTGLELKQQTQFLHEQDRNNLVNKLRSLMSLALFNVKCLTRKMNNERWSDQDNDRDDLHYTTLARNALNQDVKLFIGNLRQSSVAQSLRQSRLEILYDPNEHDRKFQIATYSDNPTYKDQIVENKKQGMIGTDFTNKFFNSQVVSKNYKLQPPRVGEPYKGWQDPSNVKVIEWDNRRCAEGEAQGVKTFHFLLQPAYKDRVKMYQADYFINFISQLMEQAASRSNTHDLSEYKSMFKDTLHIYTMVGDGGHSKIFLKEDGISYGTVMQVVLVVEYGILDRESKVACIHLVAQDPLVRETGCHRFIMQQVETHMTLDLNIGMLFLQGSENTENFYGELYYVIAMQKERLLYSLVRSKDSIWIRHGQLYVRQYQREHQERGNLHLVPPARYSSQYSTFQSCLRSLPSWQNVKNTQQQVEQQSQQILPLIVPGVGYPEIKHIVQANRTTEFIEDLICFKNCLNSDCKQTKEFSVAQAKYIMLQLSLDLDMLRIYRDPAMVAIIASVFRLGYTKGFHVAKNPQAKDWSIFKQT